MDNDKTVVDMFPVDHFELFWYLGKQAQLQILLKVLFSFSSTAVIRFRALLQ